MRGLSTARSRARPLLPGGEAVPEAQAQGNLQIIEVVPYSPLIHLPAPSLRRGEKNRCCGVAPSALLTQAENSEVRRG